MDEQDPNDSKLAELGAKLGPILVKAATNKLSPLVLAGIVWVINKLAASHPSLAGVNPQVVAEAVLSSLTFVLATAYVFVWRYGTRDTKVVQQILKDKGMLDSVDRIFRSKTLDAVVQAINSEDVTVTPVDKAVATAQALNKPIEQVAAAEAAK